MFTKNFYKLMGSNVSESAIGTVQNADGSTVDHSTLWAFSSFMIWLTTIATAQTNTGVVFGTGTTPPTVDDYCLSGEIIPSTVTATAAKSVESDETGRTITVVYTLTNTGADAVTIGEIGYFVNSDKAAFATLGSYGNGYYRNIGLLDRTVLDTPVTIAAGGVGQVTYTIRMSNPTTSNGGPETL